VADARSAQRCDGFVRQLPLALGLFRHCSEGRRQSASGIKWRCLAFISGRGHDRLLSDERHHATILLRQ